MDKSEIRSRYDRAAPWYDLFEAPAEVLGVRRLRKRLVESAGGRVLEVAAGTGKNFSFYPPGVDLTAVDLSAAMLERARKRAADGELPVRFVVADGERLPFRDGEFHTVVSSLTVCTFPEPVTALREMGRVCRTGGRIHLLEHGRSDREWIGRLQDRWAHVHARALGCRWNREPRRLAGAAGLELREDERRLFGIFQRMELRPPKDRPKGWTGEQEASR